MRDESIDLNRFVSPGVGVLSGRTHGEDARKQSDLDRLDSDPNVTVHIAIPSSLFSVTSSFFLGMFQPSIKRLGAGEFRRRYVFEGPGADELVEQGVRRALLVGTPLSSLVAPSA